MSLLSPSLEAFLAVTRHGTVHAAARELGLTQTGVTQRIRALEDRLSTTLFIRSRQGMRPTPEGDALLRYCQAAKDLEGEALARIRKTAHETAVRVRITGPSSIMQSRVVPACSSVLEAFPALLLTFTLDDLESRVEELRSGRAQIAVLEPGGVAREMDSRLLRPERYVLVASARWKGRALRDILETERIIDFDPTDPMSFAYLKAFNLQQHARTDRHFVNNTEALAELLVAGRGYGVLTAELARPYLDRGRLAALNGGKVHENRLALAWYPRPRMPAYFSALLQAIR